MEYLLELPEHSIAKPFERRLEMPEENGSGTVADFAGHLLGVFNSGMLALMIGVGHRTRLFDVMASLPPSKCSEIADAAGLDERYVREWLGAMTTGGSSRTTRSR